MSVRQITVYSCNRSGCETRYEQAGLVPFTLTPRKLPQRDKQPDYHFCSLLHLEQWAAQARATAPTREEA